MQIHFEQEGGLFYIPSLSKPIDFDTDNLEKEQAEKLKSIVDDTHFFHLANHIGNIPGSAADYYTYTITVNESGLANTVQIAEPIEDEALQRLVDYLIMLSQL